MAANGGGCEHNLDGMAQNIARPDRMTHFGIAAHMPNHKRTITAGMARFFARVFHGTGHHIGQINPRKHKVILRAMGGRDRRRRGRDTRKIAVQICDDELWHGWVLLPVLRKTKRF